MSFETLLWMSSGHITDVLGPYHRCPGDILWMTRRRFMDVPQYRTRDLFMR